MSSSSNTGRPLKTFELFPELPVELQIKICGFANSSRVVTVTRTYDERIGQHGRIHKINVRALASPAIPATLQANHLARSEALRSSKVVLRDHFPILYMDFDAMCCIS